MAEFNSLDSNDKWVSKCGSDFCSADHNIRINPCMMYPRDMDMNYLDFQKVFQCFLKERQNFCNFCKTCTKYKRFQQLCYEYDGIILNSNRKFGRYTTAVRFNALSMTLSKNFWYDR